MPNVDGFTATKTIRAFESETQRAHVPIIAMTAFTMPEDQEKCLAWGMTDYISKPFTQEKLRDMMLKHLPASMHAIAPEASRI